MAMIIPAEGDEITVYQGRTLLLTWKLYDGPGETSPTDLTDFEGFFTVWGPDDDVNPIKLSSATGQLPTTNDQGESGVVLNAYEQGGIAVIFTDEDAMDLQPSEFVEGTDDDGNTIFTGRAELTLKDPAGQLFPYEFSDLLFIPLPQLNP